MERGRTSKDFCFLPVQKELFPFSSKIFVSCQFERSRELSYLSLKLYAIVAFGCLSQRMVEALVVVEALETTTKSFSITFYLFEAILLNSSLVSNKSLMSLITKSSCSSLLRSVLSRIMASSACTKGFSLRVVSS